MRLILAITLAFSTSAFAQFGSPNDLAFWYPQTATGGGGGGFYTPTNLPSQAAYTWHVAQDYTTNSGMGTLPDRVSGINATNTAGANTPNEGPALNGKRTLYFDGTTEYLIAQPFDTGAQPFSAHFVISITNVSSGLAGIVGSTNETGNVYFGYAGPSGRTFIRAGGGSGVNGGYMTTNTWISIVVVWNSTSTQVWTNGTQLDSVTVSTAQLEGLEIGRGGLNTSFDMKATIAELSFYTNAALTSANISNLFEYSKFTYGTNVFN